MMRKVSYLICALFLVLGCDMITGPLEERIDDLEAQTETLQSQIDSLRTSTSDVFDQVAEIENQIAVLSAELSTLADEVDSTDTELLAQIQALQAQIAELQAQLAEIVTIEVGLVLYAHYASGDEWMRFENESIQQDSSLVQVQFRSPEWTTFIPYDSYYSTGLERWMYTINVNDGYIWFLDYEYGDKVGWDYKLVIVNP